MEEKIDLEKLFMETLEKQSTPASEVTGRAFRAAVFRDRASVELPEAVLER